MLGKGRKLENCNRSLRLPRKWPIQFNSIQYLYLIE